MSSSPSIQIWTVPKWRVIPVSTRENIRLPNQTKCEHFEQTLCNLLFVWKNNTMFDVHISKPFRDRLKNFFVFINSSLPEKVPWYDTSERSDIIALTDTTKREKEKKQKKKAFELILFLFRDKNNFFSLCAWNWGGVLPNMLFFMKYIHSKWEDVKNCSAMVVILSILTH